MKNTITIPSPIFPIPFPDLFFYAKRTFFVSLLIFSTVIGYAQEAQVTEKVSVEKSVFGIQIGLIGIWAHHELKLSNQVALRSEIALSGVNTGVIEPLIALEPRWYYNLNERADKGKRIDGNSGNYVSLRASYHFYTDSEADKNDLNQVLLAPTWGIRRNIGNHFNYEAGAGIGLGFGYDDGRITTLAPYVNLRVGYRF
jgi:hypothetical protein